MVWEKSVASRLPLTRELAKPQVLSEGEITRIAGLNQVFQFSKTGFSPLSHRYAMPAPSSEGAKKERA